MFKACVVSAKRNFIFFKDEDFLLSVDTGQNFWCVIIMLTAGSKCPPTTKKHEGVGDSFANLVLFLSPPPRLFDPTLKWS